MTQASWSRHDHGDCIRLTGLPARADVQVRPGAPGPAAAALPPMAGQLIPDSAGLCFVPRFPFLDGTAYTITVNGAAAAVLTRARPGRPATTRVTVIHPTAAEVPCNLLRLYVWFSAPMSEGHAAARVRLADDTGSTITGALLPGEHELWDTSRRRLTILLDPARIKRGLPSHRDAGYPLRPGQTFHLIVDARFQDARGLPLREGAQRRYHVGGEERRHVNPASWVLTIPPAGTIQPLQIFFGRPLDHGLLARCLHVTGPGTQSVSGTARIGPHEQSWQLVPHRAWPPQPHQIHVDPILEDLAGNSVSRVFDRDLTHPQDQPRQAPTATIPFRPS
jgi:hypothetical protein